MAGCLELSLLLSWEALPQRHPAIHRSVRLYPTSGGSDPCSSLFLARARLSLPGRSSGRDLLPTCRKTSVVFATVSPGRIASWCANGGFCGPTENDMVLFKVTDPSEIKDVLANLECTTVTDQCRCCGFPGIDWYEGGQRIALTSVQHGKAIRWDGSKYDLRLSVKSGRWLVRWLVAHGVNEQDIEQGGGGPRRHARPAETPQ